jgi:hypothetical protein
MKLFLLTIAVFSLAGLCSAQTVGKSTATRTGVASTSRPILDHGTVSGRTYTNKSLHFTVTFPDTWLVAGNAFAAYMKGKGVDISPKRPKSADPASQKLLNASFDHLTILLSVYRDLPGAQQNAVARVAAEDVTKLNTTRLVKDAVDYIDLLRSSFKSIQMPPGFTYSETDAEQLGPNQFAFLDSSSKEGKTRIYATVRNGYAILFALDYTADEDLESFRDTLARADFSLK